MTEGLRKTTRELSLWTGPDFDAPTGSETIAEGTEFKVVDQCEVEWEHMPGRGHIYWQLEFAKDGKKLKGWTRTYSHRPDGEDSFSQLVNKPVAAEKPLPAPAPMPVPHWKVRK